ncbi:hypothetical protein HDU87_004791 [Geranomyces variabilis]|uniref:Non-structural maintenance of chromosomes element 1 homolog n=1 Tax=Geranomyces variabilis TaxID=109894 RepID=A0AAD5TK25_9FUNG|nr:hypothetical protein HDU87_004791 [Geranomyces variabilis]
MVQQRQALKRMFLQAYLNARFLPESQVKILYRNLCQHLDIDAEPDLVAFVSDMNKTLDVYDMELRCAHAPDTGAAYYALVNTNGDEVAQVATGCSAVEIMYFKNLLELIMNNDDDVYEVSSMDALAMTSRIKPAFSKRDAEALIERLVNAKWLVDRNGFISMSLRTVLELQTYLKEEYPDRIHECTFCMEIVTSDLPWRGIPLGTGRPVPGGSSSSSGDGGAASGRAKRARRSTQASASASIAEEEADEEEEEEEEEEEGGGPVQHFEGGHDEMDEDGDGDGDDLGSPETAARRRDSGRTSTGKRRR